MDTASHEKYIGQKIKFKRETHQIIDFIYKYISSDGKYHVCIN